MSQIINYKNNNNGLKDKESSLLENENLICSKDKRFLSHLKRKNEIIKLEYENNTNSDYIRLFSNRFFINNRNNFFLIINNKFFRARPILNTKGISGHIKIKMVIIREIIDISYMFLNCSFLISVNFKLNQNANMKYMSNNCSPFEIGFYKTNFPKRKYLRPKALSHMFQNCKKLTSLSSISLLDMKNVVDMNSLFYGCSSLQNLPDISIWNTKIY